MENLERLESSEGVKIMLVSNQTWRIQQVVVVAGIMIPELTSLSVL